MRFYARLFSINLLLLAACEQQETIDYGFVIKDVSVNHRNQVLHVHLRSGLELSQQAREALEHGVALTIVLEMELHDKEKLMSARQSARRFQMKYLPLSERYQVHDESTGDLQTYPRLRHALSAFNQLDTQVPTGPLPVGEYELRIRLRLDERRLPAPMQLPAWLSSQWQHDSEWSVWPFSVNG